LKRDAGMRLATVFEELVILTPSTDRTASAPDTGEVYASEVEAAMLVSTMLEATVNVPALPAVPDVNCRLEVPSPFETTWALTPRLEIPPSAVARVPRVLSVELISTTTGAPLPIWIEMEPESLSVVLAIR